ncbi:MAG TPA: UDP-N-acetylglucosamine 2-epimerase (non-hydrolyzing) [Thermoanaerobaculia bacterium]|nr:UDP-N-acetylglucosamine 2-epimerase (non-hydrolyzing) [Thermoanaerobaculia bacterium]
MSAPRNILIVFGTRPEAIKLAPVIQRLRRESDSFRVAVCATAQHREMLDQVTGLFGIVPDVDLDLMRPDQALNDLASRSFEALDRVLRERGADWLLVQGDTTTALCAGLAAFHRRIPVAHVEAGLRTGDLSRPFPEELNRRVVDLVAAAAFAPTARAAAALASEGVPMGRIHVTGNTVVDALLQIADRQGSVPQEDVVLITAHRRESFGQPMERIVRAVARLAVAFPATRFVHVAHPNPNVLQAVRQNAGLANVELREPVDYDEMVRLLRRCRLVLTDSGGLQEEAPTFRKPVLVLREKTERPEGIEAGLARLVGTDEEAIVLAASRLLRNSAELEAMAEAGNPYGDGRASDRIADALAGRPFVPFEPASRGAAV